MTLSPDLPQVLVIDDEMGPRESLRMLLKPSYQVHTADSVEAGIRLLREKQPDAVITDIRMPGTNGIDGLRRIREIDPHVAVIMLTGFGALETAQEALRLGANDYINKPFDAHEMRSVIGRNVERTRVHRTGEYAASEIKELNGRLLKELAQKERLASLGQASAEFVHDLIGTRAQATTVSSSCPSGLDAIALGESMIRSGAAELAIVGGADAPITKLSFAAFIASGLASYRNEEPEKASRPFDLERDSGVISEGAGIFVLEDLERAQARGARIYLEISGYARTRDHSFDDAGSGFGNAMKLALANASRTTEDVDYISAYGPGHPMLDAAEVRYIKEVFGHRAFSIPISSIKGVTGNALAAGGPFQLAACALSFRDQMIAPTANYEVADPDCDLDFVPERARKMKLDCILMNVRGLGGSASSMLVKRVPC